MKKKNYTQGLWQIKNIDICEVFGQTDWTHNQ